MKLDSFRTLEAVLRTGSFASAAAEMSLTPSAVSMQMKQLEQFIGHPLFDRSGQQVRPHPLAQEVLDTLHGGLLRLEALRHRPGTLVAGNLRLGIIESLMPPLLPGLLSALGAAHPRLSIRPIRGRSVSLTAAVKAGDINGAVVAMPPKGASTNLRWTHLERRELCLIAPPDATESTPAALLRRYPWIRYDRATMTGAMAAGHVLSLAPEKRSIFELESAPAIIALVSRGLGVSVIHLLDHAARAAYPVREVPLGKNAPAIDLALVTRKSDDDDRALMVVREQLIKEFGKLPRPRAFRG